MSELFSGVSPLSLHHSPLTVKGRSEEEGLPAAPVQGLSGCRACSNWYKLNNLLTTGEVPKKTDTPRTVARDRYPGKGQGFGIGQPVQGAIGQASHGVSELFRPPRRLTGPGAFNVADEVVQLPASLALESRSLLHCVFRFVLGFAVVEGFKIGGEFGMAQSEGSQFGF